MSDLHPQPGRSAARIRAAHLPAILMRVAGGLVAGALCWAAAAPARAEADPPGRVGRVVELQGSVSRFDHEEGRWADAERNRPLTAGDRLSTSGGGRAELRVGSTVLRLGGNSELEFARLDDERIALQLHSGALALRVRSRDVANEIEVLTAEARIRPQRGGHFRFDRIDDTTFAGSWRGDLFVDDANGLVITTGQRVELFRDGRGLRQAASTMPGDAFGSWVIAQEQREERTASARYVSPEMTGAEDLDRYGGWERHPEYGAIWYPYTVAGGWAPYRYGRWVWVAPWGWTWVDDYPWGFAPFHYGRWVYYRDRWCWAPGSYVARPVYAPAMVAWVGGAHWSASVNFGGPTVGWVPLAPREVFVPYYRSTPHYVGRVNISPRTPTNEPRPVPPTHYANQAVAGGVTVVPHDVLVRRAPVAGAVVSVSEPHRAQGTAAPQGPNVVSQPPAQMPSQTPANNPRVPPPWRDGGSPGHGRSGNNEPSAPQHQVVPSAPRQEPVTQPPTLTPPPSQRREPAGGASTGAAPGQTQANPGGAAPRRERDGRDGDREWQPRGRNAPAVGPASPPAQQPAQQVLPPAQPLPSRQLPQHVLPQGQQAVPQGGAAPPAPRAQPAAPRHEGGDGGKRPPARHGGERERPGETSK